MVLREANIEEIAGYETPEEEEDDITHNYMFFINGFISSINLAFFKLERGQGNSYTNALDNAYLKIQNRFQNKHNLFVDSAMAEDWYELELTDKRKGSGCGFYPMDHDEIYEQYVKKQEEVNKADKADK
jgi:hypothetical protein